MKNVKKCLNGNLLGLLRQTVIVQRIKCSDFISIEELRAYPLAKIIFEARKDNLHWIWCEDEIKFDSEYNQWTLPSVDLNGYFDWTGHDNLKSHLKLFRNKELKDIIWDCDYSAWYPKFTSKEGAIECIEYFDQWFDERYLGKLSDMVKKYY